MTLVGFNNGRAGRIALFADARRVAAPGWVLLLVMSPGCTCAGAELAVGEADGPNWCVRPYSWALLAAQTVSASSKNWR